MSDEIPAHAALGILWRRLCASALYGLPCRGRSPAPWRRESELSESTDRHVRVESCHVGTAATQDVGSSASVLCLAVACVRKSLKRADEVCVAAG
jgi:hypothetical protein